MKALPATLCVAAMLAGAALAGSAGCADNPPPTSGEKPVVFACVAPHGYFARQVAGDLIDVRILVGADVNPHIYAPAPKGMIALSKADLYFRAGLAFEDALCGKLADMGDGPRIVDTRAGIDLLDQACRDDHSDHRGHEHQAGGKDPHVWLSPKLAARQVATIRDAMSQEYPAHAEAFGRNAAKLLTRLNTLDARIATAMAPLKGRKFFVFHPAFGYFAAAYGLRQEAVETGGKSPSLRNINRLIDEARAEKVRVIFVQPQFSTRSARTIAGEIGGVVVPIDPLAENYVANMEALAESIRSALSGKAGENDK